MVKETKDYIDAVQKKFPFLSKSELNKIITYGLKRYAWVNRMHGDVLLRNMTDEPMTAHCGYLGFDTFTHYLRWVVKWRMKERILYRLKRIPWDGYYYIGLDEQQHKAVKKSKKIKHFKNIFLTKIQKELYHNKIVKHIWRVPWAADCGWKFFVEKLDTDKAEYIGENQYEKYHECFLGRYNDGSTSVDNS